MNADFDARFEERMIQLASQVYYPTTPDIATAIEPRLQRTRLNDSNRKSGFVWLTIALLITVISLWSVPTVRATVLDFLQIGAVRIWQGEPTAAPMMGNVTPIPTITPKVSLLPLRGRTTLAEAQTHLHWQIRLPTYPPDLGEPDEVYLQSLDGDALVLVWMDKSLPGQVRLSLHMLTSDILVWKKLAVDVVEQTTVNGRTAYWTSGPYLAEIEGKGISETRLIEGHVLIWTEAGITYRLECDLSLEEAVKVAESLR